MDSGPALLFEDLDKEHSLQNKRKIEPNNNEYSLKYAPDSISAQVEEIIGELDAPSNADLEIELRRKEKELYLCSKLGLFLLHEVNELTTQKQDLLKDHTKVLLDLQSYHYEVHKDEMFDVDAFSELPQLEDTPEILDLKSKFEESNTTASSHLHRLENLQNEIDEMSHSRRPLHRSSSVDSLTDLQSVAESTMTSMSVSKNLQTNLEKLQVAHERITRLELHLDASRAKYRSLMTEYSQRLKELSRNLGTCVERARPYFETVAKARKAQGETQQAAMQYKRACNLQKVAKDMVKVAEERLFSSNDRFDTTWQEMLNQATVKVNDASREKDRIHTMHLQATKAFKTADEKREKLQVLHQRNIVKSKPYYEVQQDFQSKLESVTKCLNTLEVRLLDAKQRYSAALVEISKTGNEEGSLALKSLAERGIGVGAENPVLNKFLQENERRMSLSRPHKQVDVDDVINVKQPDAINDDIRELEVLKSKRFNYNPYDLMYLNQIDSEANVSEEYNQDF